MSPDRATTTPSQRATVPPTQRAATTPTQRSSATPSQRATGTPTQPATGTPTQPATGTPTQRAAASPTEPATATPSVRVGASPAVRVVVVEASEPHCGLDVGDTFEVVGSRLTMPIGRPFCATAMTAVFPVLGMQQGELPIEDWLLRKPYICCPLAGDGVVLRLERLADGGDV